MARITSVDAYLAAHPEWADALVALRDVLGTTELEETVKWGAPCYCLEGKNVVGIGAFKGYCGLWFHQGAFLADPDGVLVNAQEGKTRGLRQWRFGAADEIDASRVRAYVEEAIANQRAGREIAPQRAGAVELPAELTAALEADSTAQRAFAALTPGRQREYAAHVADAKRAATRQTRIEKILPMIRAGSGLNDRYRS